MAKERGTMTKRGVWAGWILCLLTACLLTGTAMAAAGQTPASGTFPSSTVTWTLTGTKLTIGGGAIPDLSGYMTPATDADPATDFAAIWANVRGKVTSVEFGKDVTGIGDYAFYNCPRLTSISFQIGSPNATQITTVGNHAFEKCVSLEKAPLPASITSIGDSAFSECTRLGSVIISHNVTAIGSRAFYASGLTSAFIPNQNATIGSSAFDSCSKLARVHYCGPYDSWKDQITGGPGGADIQIDYNIVVHENASHQTCNQQKESYWQIRATCNKCGQTFDQREPLPRMDHDVETVSADVLPTCDQAGHTAGSKCKREDCGEVISGWAYIAPLGHEYGDQEPQKDPDDPNNKEATCTAPGSVALVRTCTRSGCGHKEPAGTKILDQLPHTEPAADQVKVVLKTPATCTQPRIDLHTFVCTECKNNVTVEVPGAVDPNQHTPDGGTVISETKPTCTAEGQRVTEIRCRDCNKILDTNTDPIQKLGHLKPADPKQIEEEITLLPGCGTKGTRELRFVCTREGCPDAGTKVTVPEDIPPTGQHTEIVKTGDERKDATCMASGLTETVTCSVCDQVLKESEIIPRDDNAHPEKEIKTETEETKPATCTEDGIKTVTKTCNLCKKVISKETVVIPAAHTLEGDVKPAVKVNPTCDKPGVRVSTQHCSVCDKWIELPDTEEAIPALGGGHEFGEWVTINDPKEGEPAIQQRTCHKQKDGYTCGYTETRVVADPSNIFTINLDLDGGTLPEGVTSPLKTGADGRLAALPTPTREGWTFVGWYTAALLGEKVTTDTVFTESTMIFARWSGGTERFTVTFDPNGGTLEESDKTAQTGTDGKLTSMPVPTRSGCTFDGWYTAKDGGSKIPDGHVFTRSTVLYAHWTEGAEPGFTVTLDPNGGVLDGDVKSLTTGEDGKLAALPKDPTRSGYTFDGWYDAKTDGNQITASTVFDKDTTIYARWSEASGSTYAIRLEDTDYGTLTASASTAAKGDTVTIYADPDSGYKLSSMRVTDGSGTKVELTKESASRFTFTMPGSPVDVTASFIRDSSSSDNSGDPSTGSWNNGGSWHPADENAAPDPVPVVQSVPQINAYGQAFRDVPQGHWASGEIAWAAQNGYMNGIGGGAFAPNRNITHQQLWTVLTRLLSYTNVSDSNLRAVRAGLLDSGSPNSPTTRQEMVTALYRCAFLLGGARSPSVSINSYPDSARVAGYAREAMAWAVTNGILTGTSDGRLNPTGTVTRAQFAVFLFRFGQRYR